MIHLKYKRAIPINGYALVISFWCQKITVNFSQESDGYFLFAISYIRAINPIRKIPICINASYVTYKYAISFV